MEWNLEDWANFSTIITGGVAVVALAGAIWQVVVGRLTQREATASALYGSYLELAVEHPMLARGHISPPPDTTKVDPEFERYEWFVSVMLHAFEQILELTKGDTIWRKAITDQIDYHKEYLSSPVFIREHYSATLCALFPAQKSRQP